MLWSDPGSVIATCWMGGCPWRQHGNCNWSRMPQLECWQALIAFNMWHLLNHHLLTIVHFAIAPAPFVGTFFPQLKTGAFLYVKIYCLFITLIFCGTGWTQCHLIILKYSSCYLTPVHFRSCLNGNNITITFYRILCFITAKRTANSTLNYCKTYSLKY